MNQISLLLATQREVIVISPMNTIASANQKLNLE